MTDRRVIDGPLILGAGLAGLSAALAASPREVLVVSPGAIGEACSSSWAQGGMAAALAADDTPELHARDTEAAGAGLVDPHTVRLLTAQAATTVESLAALGAPFDRDADGRFAQSLEAAHSRARIARVKGDQAGAAIMAAVVAAVRREPRIAVLEHAGARALMHDTHGRVRGALVEHDGALIEIVATSVILATGGLGGLYAVTTNPAEVRGEGLALAALAGADIADAEFVQFHPTAVDVGRDPAPLATEALRGEGAILIDRDGRRFMDELAPRDVVARAVHQQIVAGHGAFLDATQAVGAHFPDRFPAVFAACMSAGVDPRTTPIPVAPAAHYHMGGVAADAEGRTSLEGLYAVGECACTGVHGANRLASNSLLEAAAFGAAAGGLARDEQATSHPILPAAPAPDLPPQALAELRAVMSRDAGVVRDEAGLTRLLQVIDDLEARHGRALPLAAARLVANAALAREESRGGHYRSDFPKTADHASRSLQTITLPALAAE
ncbi:MAG TPA: L-aspartate oxidase [Caulobacteraceae bacterium]|nr:L-aspartate oxidase [Caulobacteraceae bacterium]